MTSPSNIQLIPLNRLKVSDFNVRRRDRKVDIDGLAASISAHGLLQNLSVIQCDRDRFEVVAGGRRLAALKALAKAGSVPKDYAVPCAVLKETPGKEASLAENVHRIAMDVMDEVNAFAGVLADGLTADEIARRFGVTRRHVEQRLALANLSPLIKAAWKRGDINLDCARAFCMVEDHAQQNAVFRSLGKPVTQPALVRARLMDGRVRASDRLAVFVGLEAYEEAGGGVLRDLFDAEAVFLADPALLTRLAEDKLDAARAGWLAQGWGWVDLNLASRMEGLSPMRLYPEWRDPTPEEKAELERLEAAIGELDVALEADGVEDDPRWSDRDDLEAEYETIRQAARCWNSDLIKLAGVLLSVDQDGEVLATEGLVRAADQKAVDAYRKAQRKADDEADAPEQDAPDRVASTPLLPKAVARDLTLARTCAIRLALSADPDISLAVCVAALAHRCLRRSEMIGVSIAAQLRQVDDHKDLDEARGSLDRQLPDDELATLDWALGLSRDRLLAILAILTASTLDLAHDGASTVDHRLQAIGDRLAQHLDVDMTRYWKADHDYWLRLPKSVLLNELTGESDAPAGSAGRDTLRKAHAKLRKVDLVARVAALHEKTGYLPSLLVTPIAAGALEVTQAGEAMLAAGVVAAE